MFGHVTMTGAVHLDTHLTSIREKLEGREREFVWAMSLMEAMIAL